MSQYSVESLERPLDVTPWKKRSPNFRYIIIATALIPILVSFAASTVLEISGAGILLIVFLPLQLQLRQLPQSSLEDVEV